jgi:hypothetical protein
MSVSRAWSARRFASKLIFGTFQTSTIEHEGGFES